MPSYHELHFTRLARQRFARLATVSRAALALDRLAEHATPAVARYVAAVELGLPKKAILAASGIGNHRWLRRQVGLTEDRRDDPALDDMITALARVAA